MSPSIRGFGWATSLVALLVSSVLTSARPSHEPTDLRVHEWGTFSSFSGSDGVLLRFNPANTDLPQFVYRSKSFTKESISGTVSLETPVVYFYCNRPQTAIVRAQFPAGIFTEWFPRADRISSGSTLTWPEVRILPGADLRLAVPANGQHYCAARETDAAPVEVAKTADGTQVEREHFLFYRGVGTSLKTPLHISAIGRDCFALRNAETEPILSALLLESKQGRIRFRELPTIASATSQSVTLPANWSTPDAIRGKLLGMLTKAGLFEKEAKAMIKTWETAWFSDDGTRVLYLLPESWTNSALPLQVTPAPTNLVRVMVGRHDILTPERERELDFVVQQVNGPQGPAQASAAAELGRLGRFAAPARKRAEERLALGR